MSTLLISDLHLSPERPVITRAFLAFLQQNAGKIEALYILGDLFEAWIGDDDPSPLAKDIQQALKELTLKGTKLYFQHGNRDFLVGKRFARATGASLLPEHYVATIEGSRVLLLHGDTLCTKDLDYQKFRKRVRNPFIGWLMAHLPLKKRQDIAAKWRAGSKSANANKADNIMDVTAQEVEKQLLNNKVDLMIHGHTHRPGRHQHKNGERIVLGDWDKLAWQIEFCGDEVQLSSFDLSVSS
ncbi:MAG: UDP-2,3-diacylglucosamine diphosphatase [Pseudomonadales bacterium]